MAEKFFDEQSDQSEVKAELVATYFPQYMAVIGNAQKRYGGDRINYIDLFAGPGRYEDGAKSTPVKIVEQAIGDPEMRQRLVAIFNDKDEAHVRALATTLRDLPGYDTLKFPPRIFHGEVDEELVTQLEQAKHDPTLFFRRPLGVQGDDAPPDQFRPEGLGLRLLLLLQLRARQRRDREPAVEPHMDALFGKGHADSLRARFADSEHSPPVREAYIVEEMTVALNEMGGKFVLPFRFRSQRGTRTTHHLFFVSKSFKAYDLMKTIMRKQCTSTEHGRVNFEYSPASEQQPGIFGYMASPDDLGPKLLRDLAGKTLGLDEIYESLSVGTPFVLSEFRAAILKLEREKAVTVTDPTPGKQKRRMGTLAPRLRITFK